MSVAATTLSRGMPRPLAYIQPRSNSASASPARAASQYRAAALMGSFGTPSPCSYATPCATNAAVSTVADGGGVPIASAHAEPAASPVTAQTSSASGQRPSKLATRARTTGLRRIGADRTGLGLRLTLVPEDCLGEARAKVVRRAIAEQPLRLADVGLGVADVAGSKRLVSGRRHGQIMVSLAQEVAHGLVQLLEAHAAPDCDVVDLPDCLGVHRRRGEHVRLHDIAHVAEVAAG